MKMILCFVCFGFFAAFVFDINSIFISKVRKKAFTVTLDIIYCVSMFCVFFCLLVGYSHAQMRYYYFVLAIVGFLLENCTVHKMFKKCHKKLLKSKAKV